MKKINREPAPDPFPLKQQYVKVVCAARDAAGMPQDPDDEDGKAAAPGKRKLESGGGEAKPWVYNEKRLAFIKRMKDEKQIPFAEAKEMWNNSTEKGELLGSITVKELKRRKFIPKTATENPWAGSK